MLAERLRDGARTRLPVRPGRILYKIAFLGSGFPPSVLDRGEGRCREGKATVFRLDGLDSLHIAEEDGGKVAFIRPHVPIREGSRRRRESCSATRSGAKLGLAVARFLTSRSRGSKPPRKSLCLNSDGPSPPQMSYKSPLTRGHLPTSRTVFQTIPTRLVIQRHPEVSTPASRSNSASSITVMFNCFALSSLLPASSPART